ncbi:hypothetical protein OOT46_23630 [Aquabacterium sp. A7-Y]|uniref:hypothetical protein n=1 Tax=Aquabacterium sp. A7-Y TaxID=1349605 RepID=UPI00223CCFC8|nr:hypothetical protein [Aquabacterium sp. A7-Y]MCW7540815.1 hypothetical protein [Aquabacterium sp. A7-Y]
MPNSTRPSGPGQPRKEALDRVEEREGIDEGVRELGEGALPPAHQTPPRRSFTKDSEQTKAR